MAPKNKLFLYIFCVLTLTACSSGISKKEQEQFIRKEYPQRRHDALWRSRASTCKQLLEPSIGYIELGSPWYLMFWEQYNAFRANGVLDIMMDRVSAKDAEEYKPEYREYMSDAIRNMFIDAESDAIDHEYTNIELLTMQLQEAINFATTFEDDESVFYIFDYLYGHIKATTPVPVITGMEYIKSGSNGLPYWRVHFDDGASHNVRVYKTDSGTMDLERVMFP